MRPTAADPPQAHGTDTRPRGHRQTEHDTMMRMVDALLFHEKNGEVCPAGWQQGDAGMSPTADGVADYLASKADSL